MAVSLSTVPHFEQIRLQSLEIRTKSFHCCFHHLRRRISIFRQEREDSASVKRCQCLNNVVVADYGFMIGGGKLVNCFYLYFFCIVKLLFVKVRNQLYLCK